MCEDNKWDEQKKIYIGPVLLLFGWSIISIHTGTAVVVEGLLLSSLLLCTIRKRLRGLHDARRISYKLDINLILR